MDIITTTGSTTSMTTRTDAPSPALHATGSQGLIRVHRFQKGPGIPARSGHGLQDHHHGLRRPERSIGVQPRVDFTPSRPQARPFVSLRRSSPHLARSVDEIDARVGMRLEVQPPGRLAISPAVHRHRGKVGTVLKVGDDHAVLPSGAAPSGRQSQGPPAVAPGTPEPDPTRGNAVQTPVRRPEETDEPAWRKSWRPLVLVRHHTLLSPPTWDLPRGVGSAPRQSSPSLLWLYGPKWRECLGSCSDQVDGARCHEPGDEGEPDVGLEAGRIEPDDADGDRKGGNTQQKEAR